MSADLIAICKERGRLTVDKPRAITAKKEIVELNDMALLLEVYQKLNAVDFSKLKNSLSAIGALHEVASKYHGPKSALVLMVETLTVEKFEGEDKEAVDSLLAELKEVYEKYLRLFDEKNPLLSSKARARYKEAEKQQKGPLHLRAIKALKTVIGEIGYGLSVDAKRKLQIRGEDWINKLSTNKVINQEKINYIIWERCKPGQVIKKLEPYSKLEPKPKPEKPSFFNYSLRLAPGYGLRPLGKDNPELLAQEGRGILTQSAASAEFKLSERSALQIDYNFSTSYDVEGKDYFVFNHSHARVSSTYRSNNLDLLVQAGWNKFRTDYPSKDTPDLNALVQNLRLNYLITSNLFLNLDQNLMLGKTNESFPVDQSDFRLIGAEGKLGGAYQAGPFIPFLGLIGGYGKNGEIYGGYLGLGINHTRHEANLLAQYTNDKGITAAARYFLSQGKWGMGTRVFYNHDLEDRYQMGIGIDVLIKLAELWGNDVELQPFVNATYEMASDPALNINGGITIRFGGLRPSEPSSLRPYSIQPLPEAR